ncbi:MAG TPA: hypothetical protein PLT26_09570, partial [Anaerolineaceae bacterium]|nr:hypothetical protein [Anaerolineaceae bacterium]HQH86432.1 hypothetical protein [Anaerolineaceae bacterium]
MNYEHRFRVQAALSRVRNFHSRAESMAAITPPPVFVKMKSTPATLNENDIMDFTMWMGPLPIHLWLFQENVRQLLQATFRH